MSKRQITGFSINHGSPYPYIAVYHEVPDQDGFCIDFYTVVSPADLDRIDRVAAAHPMNTSVWSMYLPKALPSTEPESDKQMLPQG